MEHNIYLYLLVMAVVTYLVRALPLLFIRREISNPTIRLFFHYVPYATLTAMTFPAVMETATLPVFGLLSLAAGVFLAWKGGGLLTVSAVCCAVVYICEKVSSFL